jgi:hypothetical protein
MATERYFTCNKCSRRSYPTHLFDALVSVSRETQPCDDCGEATDLHVVFHFGLEAGDPDCKVLAVFVPSEPSTWRRRDKAKVTFFPLLVILERDGSKTYWLPYWHIVEIKGKKERKYGQWAPFMDQSEFGNLLAQARKAGYIVH